MGETIHPCVACPECDDVQNDACTSCEGTDQYCPICCCPAHYCEFPNEACELIRGDDFDDDGPWTTIDNLMGELSPESDPNDNDNESYDEGYD